MTHEAQLVHRLRPPCTCDDCLRATAQADQHRAMLDEMLRSLDTAKQQAAEVAK
jgi:hypothetical protein